MALSIILCKYKYGIQKRVLYFHLLLSAKSLKKNRADFIKGFSPFGLFLYMQKN
jgi:hypothetical protein